VSNGDIYFKMKKTSVHDEEMKRMIQDILNHY